MMRREVCLATVVGLLLASAPLGCASSRTTTVKTQEQVRPGATVGTQGTRVSQATTTTTVTRAPEESRGVLSTAIHFVGEVISWPFRLIGALFRALF